MNHLVFSFGFGTLFYVSEVPCQSQTVVRQFRVGGSSDRTRIAQKFVTFFLGKSNTKPGQDHDHNRIYMIPDNLSY